MPFIRDAKDTKRRLSRQIEAIQDLLREYYVEGDNWPAWIAKLKEANLNPEFRAKRNCILKELVEEEGGKLSLTTALAVIGAVLGGIGIAGFGGAIGVPLAAVLGAAGLILGNELDSYGFTKKGLSTFRRLLWSTDRDAEENNSANPATADYDRDDLLVVMFESQANLAIQCEELHRDNLISKEKLTSLSGNIGQASAELQALKAEVASLGKQVNSFTRELASARKQNSYLQWGLVLIGLLVLAELLLALFR